MDIIDKVIEAMVEFRWNNNTLYVHWKKIANHLKIKHKVWIDREFQKDICRTDKYHTVVLSFILQLDSIVIQNRIVQSNRTVPEYLAYVFGIDIARMRLYCENLGFATTTEFSKNDGGRSQSEIRKSGVGVYGQGDCAIRAISLAVGKPYDEILLHAQNIQNKNPTIFGCYQPTTNEILKENGWHSIDRYPWKKPTLYDLFQKLPQLKKLRIVFRTPRHLFFVDKGVIQDLHDPSSSKILQIFVHKNDLSIAGPLIGELTLYSLVNKLLKLKRDDLNRTWKDIAAEMNLKDYDIESMRKTPTFFEQLDYDKGEWDWALPKPDKDG